MIHKLALLNSFSLQRSAMRAMVISALTCLGIVASSSLVAAHDVHLSLAKPVEAQVLKQDASFDATEIRNYALSVLDLENLRQRWSVEIASQLDVETLPAIACNEPTSIRDLNRDIRAMVVQFCNESMSIVAEHNLSVGRFNAITQSMVSNPALQERISEELLNLQRDSQASVQ